MHAPPHAAGGPWLPAAVTLPSLRAGGIHTCLATIFTELGGTDPGVGYPEGDAHAAHTAGLAQLAVYQRWHEEGHVSLDGSIARPRLAILMECADPIRTPEEVHWWAQQGVIAIGMAWARGSRYAHPDKSADKVGLSNLGSALVREIDKAGLVHDVSHLSDAAFAQLLDLASGPIIASHSNCRAIVDPTGANQRHLTDAQIAHIVRRGGVIGLNLFSRFLVPGGWKGDTGPRATIAQTIAHIEHICNIAGHTYAVGLGSDMDGGFSASTLPEGIHTPSDLGVLLESLSARGWSDQDVQGFAHANWQRVFAKLLEPRAHLAS
jgi:membrane dipeptidase